MAVSTTLCLPRFERESTEDLRKEAAHTHVDDVIGLDDFLAITDLVGVLCAALAEMLSNEVMRRRHALGQLVVIGEVVHVYASGMIPIVKMKPCRVAVGEEVVILRGTDVRGLATICSVQDGGRGVDAIEASMDQELGIRLDRPCRTLNSIGRVAAGSPDTEQLELFVSRGISTAQVSVEAADAEGAEETLAGDSDPDTPDE